MYRERERESPLRPTAAWIPLRFHSSLMIICTNTNTSLIHIINTNHIQFLVHKLY